VAKQDYQQRKNSSVPVSSGPSQPEYAESATSAGGGGVKAPAARVYKGTQELDHDLFKLKVGTMLKDISFTDMPDLVKIEHCHIFHTIDSNGKKQHECNAVGGHTHSVEVVETDGVPSLVVGPASRWTRQRVKGGRMIRVLTPIEHDDHTHDWEYLGSERIRLRENNMEFAKYQAMVKEKQEPTIDGVVG
jgi:hypothetical protein